MQAEIIQTATTEALAFKLGGEEYGINILKVQEVRGYDAAARIVATPKQFRPAPDISTALNTDHLIGLSKIAKRMVIYVDIDRPLSSTEMGIIENVIS